MGGEAGRDDGGGRLDRAEQDFLGEGLLVDGVGEGAADERVVEGRDRRIEGDVEDGELGAGDEELVERVGGIADALEFRGGDAADVDLAVFELIEAAAGEADFDALHLGGFEVVVVEAFEHDPVAFGPFGQLEGAAAVGQRAPAVRVGLDFVAVDDEGSGVGELVEEVGLGRVDGDVEGEVVDHLDAGDRVDASTRVFADADDVAEEVGRGGGERFGVGVALEAPFDVLGCDAAAVVEGGVAAEGEAVGDGAVGIDGRAWH